MQLFWQRLGFGGRLTLSMISLFLAAILLLTSLLFVRYQDSQTDGVVSSLRSAAELNADAFTDWLLVRQDEMRLLATLPSVQQLNLPLATELMQQLAQNSGFYDTIFVVGPDGLGMAGVSFANGQAKVLSEAEANAFNVADRAWFKQAIAGQDTFSQPVVVLVLATVVCLLLVKKVTRTLGGEPEYAAAVVQRVAEGDLSGSINLRPDDSSSLLAAIAQMQQRLRQMLGEVSNYSDQVAAASTELSQINQQTSAGMQQQNTEISSAAVAMNEMTSTLEEVSRNTQQAAEAAAQAEQESKNGRQIVSTTIRELANLSKEVSSAATIIRLLKKDSDQIGNILQVIEGIAEQTNLLALNAAIEAARAGESGRGFAVVADEVRTLASRTKDSTTEIKQMIDKLQHGTDNAVKATDNSEQAAKSTAERAAAADQALAAIYEAVELISSTTHQIATATEQQTVVSRDINQNFHRISDVAYQTNDNVSQSAQASDSLSTLAEQLQELVRRFRL